MSDARWVGIVLAAAQVAILAYVLVPLLLKYRRVCRDLDEARREWDRHIATTPGLEPVADVPLYDRIAHDQMAPFFAEWSERVES